MLREKARWLHAGGIKDSQFRQMNNVLDGLAIEETGADHLLAHMGDSRMSERSIEELIEAARQHPPMTRAERVEQRISFVYGNCVIDNPRITREMVEEADRKLHPEDYPDDRPVTAPG